MRDASEAALDVEARGHDFSTASSRDGALGRRATAAAVTSRPSRSSPHDVAAAVCGGRAFEREERRDSQTDEVVVGRADRERKGRSDRNGAAGNGRAVHVGSKEDVGGLSPPTDAVYGLAGLYVPASASCDGACIRAPPQPTGRGVARRNRGCGGCGESGVTADA